jgi:hypothetical protein
MDIYEYGNVIKTTPKLDPWVV